MPRIINVRNLSINQVHSLKVSEIRELTNDQLESFSEYQIRSLTQKQCAALNLEQLRFLINNYRIHSFLKDQFRSLATGHFNQLTQAELDKFVDNHYDRITRLSGSQFIALNPDRLRSEYFTNLHYEQIHSLSNDKIATFFRDQITVTQGGQRIHIPRIQLVKENLPNIFTTGELKAVASCLSIEQLNNLHPDNLKKVLGLLTNEQIQGLDAEHVKTVITKMSDTQLRALRVGQLSAITSTELHKLDNLWFNTRLSLLAESITQQRNANLAVVIPENLSLAFERLSTREKQVPNVQGLLQQIAAIPALAPAPAPVGGSVVAQDGQLASQVPSSHGLAIAAAAPAPEGSAVAPGEEIPAGQPALDPVDPVAQAQAAQAAQGAAASVGGL